MPEKHSVYEKYTSGPHGIGTLGCYALINRFSEIHFLGDPDDLSLRKVELDVMIPKKMRDIARTEKCFKEVENFTECCKNTGLLMVVKCREENSNLKSCLTKWYENEQFKERCKNEYLAERSEYRRTGITLKQKQRIGSSM